MNQGWSLLETWIGKAQQNQDELAELWTDLCGEFDDKKAVCALLDAPLRAKVSAAEDSRRNRACTGNVGSVSGV